MKLTITSLFAAALIVAPTFVNAQDGAPDAATKAAARELLQVAETENMMNEAMEKSMEAQMGPLKQLGISPGGLAKLKVEMLSFMKEVMKYEDLEPVLVDLYAKNFTKTELEEITAFYKTPTGKKAITVAPALMAEGMALGQAKVQERMPELQARIMPIIQAEMAK